MSDQTRPNNDEDLAYGNDYSSNRGYYDQPGNQGNQDRGIIGDTFKKFKTKYDQYQGQKPPQDYGYGNNPSSSTVGSQQYGGSGYAGGPYNQQQQQQQQQQQFQSPQSGQPAYPGGPPPQKPQPKPAFADKLLGGLIGSVTSIGHDVHGMIGGSQGQRPPGSNQQQGYQTGLQPNIQSQTNTGSTQNRYESTFAGPKSGNDVKWYVDGCSYMYAVSQALENAKQTIWILDWWLSPELYLRRPPSKNEEWRIDKVLQRAANRGVKVNIIVYKEVTQALTLSSSHTKHALENLSPNIGVFRHPDHLPDAQTTHSSILSSLQGLKLDAEGLSKLGSDSLRGIYGLSGGVILYWAHHEKLCLIDGATAFMGGLDLCFGRWDTNQHPIADAHPSDLNKIVFPGQDFNNARVMDFSEVNIPSQNKLDRTKSSRMGWSDISICLRGPCVGDLIHHFVDRWNFIYDEKYNVRKDLRYQRLPNYPDHHANEGPISSPDPGDSTSLQGATQTPGQSSNQFPQPTQGTTYNQPPWQASNKPTTATGDPVGLATLTSQSYQPLTGYQQQGVGQQNFPPPPPGPPPIQGSLDPSQQSGYPPPLGPTQTAHSAQQYNAGQPQASFPPPPPNAPAGPSQGQYDPSHTQQSYPQVPGKEDAYGSSQQSQQAYHQPQYIPDSTIDTRTTTTGQAPTFSQPTQAASVGQSSYQSQPPASHGQPSVTPTGPPQSQIAIQQYAAYTAPSNAGQQGPPGSQGPAELSTSQSSQYRPYDSQPTARGFDVSQDYDSGHGAQRGFGDDAYNNGRGEERAFGNKPAAGAGRFDKYKDEARKFKDEGKIFGVDVGRYGEKLESRLDGKLDGRLAGYTSGRFGRPQSAVGGGMSCQLVRSCTKWSNGTGTEKSIQNAYIDLIQNAKYFIYIENQFFITATGDKQKPVKNQIGKAIVDRIIRASREQQPFKVIVNIPSVPAFAGDIEDEASLGTRAIMEFQYFSICRGGHSIMEEIAKAGINPMDYIRFYNLRNYDRINVTPAMQQAQQQAGIGYDDARKQYESQLGSGYGGYGEIAAPISAPGQPGPQQTPGVQQGQYQFQPPPQQAQSQFPPPPSQQTQSQFPPPPSQSGPPQFPPPPQQQQQQQRGYGSQPPAQAHNQYQQAAQAAPHVKADDWDSVSSCYMLGGQDIRNVPWSGPPESEIDAFVSEELYIHSKVMIVDDQTVICGSANLNDRSMLGTHDSEIALVINDSTPVQSTMAGRPWQASRFAASLRRQLFRKHLGLLRPQDMQTPDDNFMPVGVPNTYDWGTPEDNVVSDPLSDTFQSLWNTRARTNTEVFRKAFRAVPDDYVRNWNEYKEYYEYFFIRADAKSGSKNEQQRPARVEYGHVVRSDFPGGVKELKDLLSRVKGTLVEMPLCFLQEEDIAKEGLSFNALTSDLYT